MAATKTVENHLKTGGEEREFASRVSGTHEISPLCREVFEELKIRRKHRYILFRIGDEEIEVESTGTRDQNFASLKPILPYTECRYCVFDHEYKTPDGRPVSKLWFISWFPNNSTPHCKMAYTTAKTKLREVLPGVFDVQASSFEELEIGLGLAKPDEDDDEDFDF